MRRRELLRLLAITSLAGCTRVADETSAPVERAQPTSSPSPAEVTPEPSPAAEPSPEPAPEPEPEPAPARARTVVAIDRDALGLPVARSGGRAHTITALALHHTAAPTAPASKAPARFRSHTAAHRDQGWVDVAYHWGVDVAGNIYQLRSESIAGDTNTSYDPAGWFLVVCEGNFEESSPPQAMLDAVADLFAYASARFGVAPSTLRGHRDLAATACPGKNLQSHLPALVKAVDARLAAGGVALRVEDDPARVTRIESS